VTIVADFGDNLSPKTATVAENGDSRRKRRQSPKTTVAEFGDSRRFWRQSPNSATIVASVVRALHVTGTTHNVVGLVNNSTRLRCSQVPTPSTASRLVINTTTQFVGTTNPQQIAVMKFALIVADYSRQCGRAATLVQCRQRHL